MKRKKAELDPRVKSNAMGWPQFFMAYATMLILVGMQVGIIVMPGFLGLHAVVQVTLVMGYWALVALGFAFITKAQIQHSYDKPMRRLSLGAKKVAEGDFSVYLKPLHTADKYDYIDVMFLDFNTMVKELGSTETLKNDFVGTVSHEIKTPLAIIKNYISALESENLSPEKQKEYMDTITKAADKLSDLVSNILRLNKLDNQEIISAYQQYDICRQLADCALSFESLWEEKGIDLFVHIDDRAMITADENMLEIVWNNLLSNALKFTSYGGKVSLVQTSDADTITVTISDTGCGMSSETARHIFDKFYQGDSSHSGEGNGLGLAISHRVVEKLGGTLAVVSKIGKGSTFTVTLPTQPKRVGLPNDEDGAVL